MLLLGVAVARTLTFLFPGSSLFILKLATQILAVLGGNHHVEHDATSQKQDVGTEDPLADGHARPRVVEHGYNPEAGQNNPHQHYEI